MRNVLLAALIVIVIGVDFAVLGLHVRVERLAHEAEMFQLAVKAALVMRQ